MGFYLANMLSSRADSMAAMQIAKIVGERWKNLDPQTKEVRLSSL
jgi:hypothetical protein